MGAAPEGTATEARMTEFREACRRAGLKMTPQRMAIFRQVATSREHPGVDDVLAALRDSMPGLSPDTVYRTLSTFERLGLVFRVQELCDRTRFDAGLHPHGHFLCTECGAVLDFDLPPGFAGDVPPAARALGECRGVHVQVRGQCAQCAATDNS